jgi:hypothetical protein
MSQVSKNPRLLFAAIKPSVSARAMDEDGHQFRHLFQPSQLVWVADGVDPGDQVILDHQTHRSVVASDIEPGAGHAVEPGGRRYQVGEVRHAGQERHHPLGPDERLPSSRHQAATIGDQHHIRGKHFHSP